MALDSAKNFSKVTVSTGYDAAALSVVLTTGHGTKLPAAPFNVVWWNSTTYSDPSDDPNVEICRVTVIATDTLTITRAQEGTSASTKNTGGSVYKMIAGLTAKVINTDIFAQADTHYWSQATAQTGLTGDKTGSFTLETSGKYKITGGLTTGFLKANGDIDSTTYVSGTPWTGLGYITASTLSIVSDSPLSGAGTSASHLVITPDATHRWLTDTLTNTWNAKQNAITTGTTAQYFRGDLSLATFPTIPSVGSWGALNYPTWASGTPFVKMTAAGTFVLDTNTYLTSLSGAWLNATNQTGLTGDKAGAFNLETSKNITGNELIVKRPVYTMTAAPLIHGGVNYDLGTTGAVIINDKSLGALGFIVTPTPAVISEADGVEGWGVALCSIGGAQYGTLYFKNSDFIAGTNPHPGTGDNDYIDTWVINVLGLAGTTTNYYHESIWVAGANWANYTWTNPDAKAIVAGYTDPPTFTDSIYSSTFRGGAQTGDIRYTFPSALPATTQLLSSDNLGNLAWNSNLPYGAFIGTTNSHIIVESYTVPSGFGEDSIVPTISAFGDMYLGGSPIGSVQQAVTLQLGLNIVGDAYSTNPYISFLSNDRSISSSLYFDLSTLVLHWNDDVGYGGKINATALPSGTLISPPTGLNVGDMWQDVTTSSQYPIIRIRAT